LHCFIICNIWYIINNSTIRNYIIDYQTINFHLLTEKTGENKVGSQLLIIKVMKNLQSCDPSSRGSTKQYMIQLLSFFNRTTRKIQINIYRTRI